jgi:hypothetical protein
MMSVIKSIVKMLFKQKKNPSGINEPMTVKEEVEIRVIRNGKVIRKYNKKGHTWTTYGLEQIMRRWLGLTNSTPNKIKLWDASNNVIYTCTDLTTTYGTETNSAYFTYITTIGTQSTLQVAKMTLEDDTATFSQVSVNGTKLEGLELIIEWKNSISGV